MSILVINPNSTESMTEGMRKSITNCDGIEFDFFTCPEAGPQEINSIETEIQSAAICLEALKPKLDSYAGFLVACFSDHPLVHSLREVTTSPVLGIFQASVLHALVSPGKFAIVTTENKLKTTYEGAIRAMLAGTTDLFLGTYSCGLGVLDLHSKPAEVVSSSMANTAAQAVKDGATAIILGCGGMTGMETAVKEAAGDHVVVIDGVQAGAQILAGYVRTHA